MLKEAKGIIASNYDCQRQGIHKIRIAKVEVSTVELHILPTFVSAYFTVRKIRGCQE